MTQTTPTPGQPLSEADVSLLQPGDWLRDSARRLCRFDHLMRSDYIWARIGQGASCGGGVGTFTFVGRPDQDGWIAWSGGENPVPGVTVEYRMRSGEETVEPSGYLRWSHGGPAVELNDIIAYRPHAPVSRPGDGVEGGKRKRIDYGKPGDPSGCYFPKEWRLLSRAREYVADALEAHEHSDGRDLINEIDAALTPPAEPVSRPAGKGEREVVAWPVVTDQWAETYCELTGRDPDGQQVTLVDGGTVTTFRDMARREIEAMLCAAPKSAVRTIATAEPAEARIRELVDQLLKTERDYSELRQSYDAVVAKLTIERAHGDKQYRRATAAEAKLARAVEGFSVIADLSVNLRRGGPDSSDLNDLSDALETAVGVAAEALAALSQPGPTSEGEAPLTNESDVPAS